MRFEKAKLCAPWAIFLVIVTMVGWDAVVTRYVLYHSQNRSLQPDDYDIQVVTADDFRSLSDPAQTTVPLSDGTILTKAAAWDSTSYKPVQDGKLFARVTTKGTAHTLYRTLPMTIFVLVFGIAGMIVTWPRACAINDGSRTGESNATSG